MSNSVPAGVAKSLSGMIWRRSILLLVYLGVQGQMSQWACGNSWDGAKTERGAAAWTQAICPGSLEIPSFAKGAKDEPHAPLEVAKPNCQSI